MSKKRAIVLLGSSLAIGIADGYFKLLAIKHLPETCVTKIPIDLVLHKNPGIAFDIPIPLYIVVIFTIIAILIMIPLFKKWWPTSTEKSVALFFVAVGAMGNMTDRIINGFTTDYILLFGRSVINLSDILIIFGTILLLVYTGKRYEKRKI